MIFQCCYFITETLRLHPAGGQLFRICNKDYVFPNGIVIKEGEMLIIPMCAVHLNPNYYPEPELFKPERFDMPIKPGAYLTFGDGPRVCIGNSLFCLIIYHSFTQDMKISYKFKQLYIIIQTGSRFNINLRNQFLSCAYFYHRSAQDNIM